MNTGHTDPPDRDAETLETDRWTVADLIDLEYYLGADEQVLHEGTAARNALTERDRTLYLDKVAPVVADTLPHTMLHRRLSLRRWLRERRAAERPQQRLLLPGRTFAQAMRLTVLGLAVIGFLLGIGAASALLSYDGHRPINVALYIFLLVFVQLLTVGGATIAWLLRRSRPAGQAVRDLSLLGRLIRPLVTRVSQWLLRHQLATAHQEVSDRATTQIGRLRSQYALYGPVSFLPMLIPAQVFGVAFNLGVILTTVGLEWFTDLAFGWETALDLTPAVIHDLARAIAWPWGWLFGEGIGYPTLDQVAGSRIQLKDPLFLLDAGHLRSWRWFLVLAVCTYGLVPRLLLLGASLLTQRHLLERLPFTQGRTQALYARLLTPKVETATHGSGHGPAMPIPALVTHQGPLARRIAGPPHTIDKATATQPQRMAHPGATGPDAGTGGPLPEHSRAKSAAPLPAAPQSPLIAADRPVAASKPTPPAAAEPRLAAREVQPAPQAKAEPEAIIKAQRPLQPETARLVGSAPWSAPDLGSQAAHQPAPAAGAIALPQAQAQAQQQPGRQPEPSPVPSPELAPKSQLEPMPQSRPEPAAPTTSQFEPALEPEPRPEPAPIAEPVPRSQPQRELEREPAAVSASEPGPERGSAPELRLGHAPEPEPVSSAELAPASPELNLGSEALSEAEPEPEPTPTPAEPRGSEVPGGIATDACLVLVQLDVDELIDDTQRPHVAELVLALTGWQVAASASFGSGSAMTVGVVNWVEGQRWQTPPARIAVIMDGSQPPITENLRFLRELRAAAGAQAQVLLALVGDPQDEDPLPPVRAFDFTDWQRKIGQLADPYLRLEQLTPGSGDGDA